MTKEDALARVSEEVGRGVRRRREELGISVEDLAARCQDAGAPQLTVNAIYVIEGGRREKGTGRRRRLVSVDEFMALAVALQLHPVDLLVSPEASPDEPYSITPSVTVATAKARDWIGGQALLRESPRDLIDLARLIALMPEMRARALFGDWLSDFDHDPRAHALLSKVLEGGPRQANIDLAEREGGGSE